MFRSGTKKNSLDDTLFTDCSKIKRMPIVVDRHCDEVVFETLTSLRIESHDKSVHLDEVIGVIGSLKDKAEVLYL